MIDRGRRNLLSVKQEHTTPKGLRFLDLSKHTGGFFCETISSFLPQCPATLGLTDPGSLYVGLTDGFNANQIPTCRKTNTNSEPLPPKLSTE